VINMKKMKDEFRISLVPLDNIIDDSNCRSEMSLIGIERLAGSMKSCGLLQPVAVRDNGDGTFFLIFGHRRLAAAKKLGWKDIRAIVYNDTKEDIVNLLENLQREDLSARDIALAIYNLLQKKNISRISLAQILGKDKSYISRMVKLAKLILQYGEKVSFTKLRASTYWELLNRPDLLEDAERGEWGQKEARNRAKVLKKDVSRTKPVPKPSVSTSQMPNQLQSQPIQVELAQDQHNTYEPITIRQDGFHIHPFDFSISMNTNIDLIIEKMMELNNKLEHVIRQLQRGWDGVVESDMEISASRLVEGNR